MSTFLQLCNSVALESGASPGAATGDVFSTVAGATGRRKRIVAWVSRAYHDIQTSQEWWAWMQAGFSAEVSSSTNTYTATALGISSRFGRWIFALDDGTSAFTIYKTADGVEHETPLIYVGWQSFLRGYQRGGMATETGQPSHMTIDPQQRIILWPKPDAAYTFGGLYYKAPQDLSADEDIPEMPAQYHKLIEAHALTKMLRFDEAPEQYPLWEQERAALYSQLCDHQLPNIGRGSAFA